MKTKVLLPGAFVCALSVAVYAQSGFAGKWQSDLPAGAPAVSQTWLDLKVEGTKVTGMMVAFGTDMKIQGGTITGKQAKWFAIKAGDKSDDLRVDWTADLTEDDTLTLRGFTMTPLDGVRGTGVSPVILHRVK